MNWLDRMLRREPQDPAVPSLRSVTFDTAGLRIENRTDERIEWHDLQADVIVAEIKHGSVAPDLAVLPALDARGHRGDVAVALNGLGLVRAAAGQHVEAIPLFERALIRFEEAEREQKQRIADRATVLNNMADALDAVGDRGKAKAARAAAKAVIADITRDRLRASARPHQ